MASNLKIIGIKFAKLLLSISAILLFIVMIIQVALASAFIWLNFSQGQAWLKKNLNEALKGSGYTVAFDSLGLNSTSGIILKNIHLADSVGVFATMDTLSLKVSLLQIPVKKLSMSLNAGTVDITRLPVSYEKKDNQNEPLQPFALPDMYFTSLDFDGSIKRLKLDETVIGASVEFSPDVKINADLSDNVKLQASISQLTEVSLAYLPEQIDLSALFDPAELQISLEKLLITTPAGEIDSKGSLGLGETGSIDIVSNLLVTDTEKLVHGWPGNVEAIMAITGMTNNPSVELNARAYSKNFIERGGDEIELRLQASNLADKLAGNINISSRYQARPVSLQSDYLYAAPVLSFSEIRGNATDLTLNGGLDLNTEDMLAQGQLELMADKLETYTDLTKTEMKGSAKATLDLAAEKDWQKASVKLGGKNLQYQSMTFKSLAAAAMFENVKNKWPQEFDLQISGGKITNELIVKNLSASLNEYGSDLYQLKLDGLVNAKQDLSIAGKAELQGLRVSQPAARNIDFKIGSKASSVNLQGEIDLEKIDMLLSAREFSLSAIPVGLPEALQSSDLTGDITLSGPLNNPVMQADMSSFIRYPERNGGGVKFLLNSGYKDNLLSAKLDGSGDGVDALMVSALIPVSFSLYPWNFEIPEESNVEGSFKAALNAAVLGNIFLTPDHSLSGKVGVDGSISGTIAKPEIAGNLSMLEGAYGYEPYEVSLNNIEIGADFTGKGLTLRKVSANDGERGLLGAEGRIGFGADEKSSVKLSMTNFHLFKSDAVNGHLDADIGLRSEASGYLMDGDISLGEFNIMIPEKFHSKIPQLNIVTPKLESDGPSILDAILLAIKVKAPNRIFVRGWGLDAEFGGNLDLSGKLDTPLINGTLNSLRGRYEEFGRRFNLERANLRFQGSVPPSPYLDIEATIPVDDGSASVLLTGPASKPEINLASTPSLPQDEIMSRILFGETMDKITPFQAVQLANTLQRFSGKGGSSFDPLGRLRGITGLDDISVETDEEGESTVGVGKYVTDKVYLEVERGKAENSGAAHIEVEITPSISLQSEVGQNAQGGAGLLWSRDY